MGSLLEFDFAAWLVKTTWQALVLTSILLMVQRLFRPWLTPRWRYRLWLLVVIRLALPFSFQSELSIFNLPRNWPRLEMDGLSFRTPLTLPASATETAPGWNFYLSVCAGVWLVGVAGLSLNLVVSTFRLNRTISKQRTLTDSVVLSLLEDCRELMGVRTPLVIVETSQVTGPALYGFLRPRLLLPEGFIARFTEEELRLVFAHELAHVKRNDIAMNWLMTVLQILHWFNPFVWLAFQRMRADRELACDDLALTYARDGEAGRYGHTIIKLLETFGCTPVLPCLAGILEDTQLMQHRIRLIANFRRQPQWSFIAVLLIVIVGTAGLTDAKSVKFPSEPRMAMPIRPQRIPAESNESMAALSMEPAPAQGRTEIRPEDLPSLNSKISGLLPDKRSLQSVRAQAQASISQITETRQELGEDAGDVLDGYLGILEKFLQETQALEDNLEDNSSVP